MTKTTQQSAIEKLEGPCLIKAGAGTGKTYTIVQKIIHIVNSGFCKPSEILCLTFSNEATNHLRRKVDESLSSSSEVTIRTFHGFCGDILREFGNLINLNTEFEILQPDDAKVLLHKYLEVSEFDANRYVASISKAKDLGISIEDIEKYLQSIKAKFGKIKDIDVQAREFRVELQTMHLREPDKEKKKAITAFLKDYDEYSKYRNFIKSWKDYDELKRKKNYLDFSDLNFNVLRLFSSFGADNIAKRYKSVIVDEFQDTNKQQFDLIEYLVKDHKNITVVGDPNQSIYRFRGSFGQVFDAFQKAFNAEVFVLDKSRRSPNKILRVAHQLIKNNYENPKECVLIENFENKEGKDVKVLELKNAGEEARKVAELVEEEIESGTPLSEICVLYRTHNQGTAIQQSLESKNIPIVSAGITDLLQKPEIRTAVAYLSLINNFIERTGTGEQAWWSLFHYHNALNPEDAVKIGKFLKMHREEELSIDYTALTKIEKLDISKHSKEIIDRIKDKIGEILKSANKPLPDLILDIYEITGLNRAFTHERTPKNVEALMNLKNFYELSENYYKIHEQSVSSFINYLEILEKLGVEVPASKIMATDAVRLMTIHAVKGLEFDKVILTNLAEDKFPLGRARNEPLIPKELNPDIKIFLSKNKVEDKEEAIKEYEKRVQLLEERRLCYVAFTRAKKELILTFARSYNKEEDSATPSTFLCEIKYNDNKDVVLEKDNEERCTIFAPCSMHEQHKSLIKKQLIDSLDSEDIKTILSRLVLYHAIREGKVPKYDIDLNKLIDAKELEVNISKHKKRISTLKFDKENFRFSPTAILEYDECPKRYELAHIFNMPARGAFGWSRASAGSFVHKLFETGVKGLYDSADKFVQEAARMAKLEEWKGVNLTEVEDMIKVFWERHKGRYDSKTLIEQRFDVDIGGYKFLGFADRIDFITDKDVEIIDYKTNSEAISPKKRAWQLGFYALAAKKQLKLNPVKLTLEMLRLDKPLEAEMDAAGKVTCGRAKGFNLAEVEKEMVECCGNIVRDYEGEFLPVKNDDPCRYCGYKFYCPKWEEK